MCSGNGRGVGALALVQRWDFRILSFNFISQVRVAQRTIMICSSQKIRRQ